MALTLEFIYMLGMKLTGDIAFVLDDNLQLVARTPSIVRKKR